MLHLGWAVLPVTHLAAIWRGRASGEAKAAQRFASFASSLDAHGFSNVSALAAKGVHDELRHAELCLRLAGTTAPAPAIEAACWSRSSLLWQAIAFCCITETLNTALIASGLERADDSEAANTLRSILRDEVTHSKLGWAVLSSVPRDELKTLEFDLFEVLRRTVSVSMLEADEHGELVAYGELLPSERRAVVTSVVKDVVLEGLHSFGLDVSAGHRWLAGFEQLSRSSVHG